MRGVSGVEGAAAARSHSFSGLSSPCPGGLGFDLNTIAAGDVTIMTSWWSGQKLVVNADTTLSTAA